MYYFCETTREHIFFYINIKLQVCSTECKWFEQLRYFETEVYLSQTVAIENSLLGYYRLLFLLCLRYDSVVYCYL